MMALTSDASSAVGMLEKMPALSEMVRDRSLTVFTTLIIFSFIYSEGRRSDEAAGGRSGGSVCEQRGRGHEAALGVATEDVD